MECKNLCAMIPADLHEQIREKQAESGETLSQYMANLIQEHLKRKDFKRMNENSRTVAFQMEDHDFYRLKAHLKRTNQKQKEFGLNLVLKVLEEAEALLDEETLQQQIQEATCEKQSRKRGEEATGEGSEAS